MNRCRWQCSVVLAPLLGLALAGPAAADVTGVTASPNPVPVNTDVTVTVTAPSGGGFGGADCSQVRVAYGDGTTDTSAAGSSPFVFHHKYATAGTVTLTATGVGPCPGTRTASLTVLVAPGPGPGGGSPSPGGDPITKLRTTVRERFNDPCGLLGAARCPPPTIAYSFPAAGDEIEPGQMMIIAGLGAGDPTADAKPRLVLTVGGRPNEVAIKAWGKATTSYGQHPLGSYYVTFEVPTNVPGFVREAPSSIELIRDRDDQRSGPAFFKFTGGMDVDTATLPYTDTTYDCVMKSSVDNCNDREADDDYFPPIGIHVIGIGGATFVGAHHTFDCCIGAHRDGGIDHFEYDLKNGWVVDSVDIDTGGTTGTLQGPDHSPDGPSRGKFQYLWGTTGGQYVFVVVTVHIRGPKGTSWK